MVKKTMSVWCPWRSFKLPRKIAGANNGETQAFSFADESLWLVRLAGASDASLAFGRKSPTSGAVCSSQILEVFLMP